MKRKIFIEQAKLPALLLVCSALLLLLYLCSAHSAASAYEDIANLNIRSSDKVITLSWNNPAFEWGSQTNLTIHSAAGSEVIQLSQMQSSYHFDEGIHGTMYTFSLQRTDADGNAGQTQSGEAMFLDYELLPDLPLISIDTFSGNAPTGDVVYAPSGDGGRTITNNAYESATMVLKSNNIIEYNGLAEIRLRGNTSSTLAKKPYKIKLSTATDLINAPDQNAPHTEWLLVAITWNIKNPVGHMTAELLGSPWQPRYRFVNLMLNGEWKGLYLLFESICADENRCNISENGFLIEDDAYWWNEEGPLLLLNTTSEIYTFKYPEVEDLTENRIGNIQAYMDAFIAAVQAQDEIYQEYIDMDSWIAWLMTHDLLGNLDAGGSNLYCYKYSLDPDNPTATKLVMGPAWDFDNIFSEDFLYQAPRVQHRNLNQFGSLMKISSFRTAYAERWKAISSTFQEQIMSSLKELEANYGSAIDESRALDCARWGGEPVKLADEIAGIQEWFTRKTAWMDETWNQE